MHDPIALNVRAANEREVSLQLRLEHVGHHLRIGPLSQAAIGCGIRNRVTQMSPSEQEALEDLIRDHGEAVWTLSTILSLRAKSRSTNYRRWRNALLIAWFKVVDELARDDEGRLTVTTVRVEDVSVGQ